MPFKIIKLPNGRYSVINRITEHNFSPKGISLEQAQRQLKAISLHYGHLDGAGIISSLKHIFSKSSKYNNISTKTLEKYGNMKIYNLVATRTKIQKILSVAMDMISAGEGGLSNKTKKMGYDDLFHIQLYARMEDGQLLLIEKNEVIYIQPTDKIKGEPLPIKYPQNSLTLKQLMDNGQKFMGNNFFVYDAFNNNCASFIVGILKGNKLWSDANTQFLNQDLSSLKKSLPATSAVSNFITRMGAVVSRVRGKGEGDVCMPLDTLIGEHKKLVNVLQKGSRRQQLSEAQDQSGELKKYLKMKGGSKMPEDDDDENLVYKAMSDADLHQYFPNAKILKYSELPRQTTPEDFLKVGEVIYILYESSPNSGHWVSLARGPDAFYYMDSYGNKPDVPLNWTDDETRKALGEDYPTLTKMFSLAKHPVYYNDYDYQSKKDTKVATCGRFATAFLIHFKKYGGNLASFYKAMKKGDEKTDGDMDDYVASVITK